MQPSPWITLATQLVVILPLLAIVIVIGLGATVWKRSGGLRAVAGPFGGGVAGLLAGYFGGAYVSCQWLWPASNMCGIAGVFVSAPIAAVAGAWAGSRMVQRTR